MNRRTLLAASLAVAGAAWTMRPEPLAAQAIHAEGGVAIDGTDPVAYFREGAPVTGDPAITHEWQGATWRFASAANRDAFAADPAAYAPQYGGHCAWAVAAKGTLVPTDPDNWAIVDGKLYLNYDDGVQRLWDADRPGFIRDADRRWPEVSRAR